MGSFQVLSQYFRGGTEEKTEDYNSQNSNNQIEIQTDDLLNASQKCYGLCQLVLQGTTVISVFWQMSAMCPVEIKVNHLLNTSWTSYGLSLISLCVA